MLVLLTKLTTFGSSISYASKLNPKCKKVISGKDFIISSQYFSSINLPSFKISLDLSFAGLITIVFLYCFKKSFPLFISYS